MFYLMRNNTNLFRSFRSLWLFYAYDWSPKTCRRMSIYSILLRRTHENCWNFMNFHDFSAIGWRKSVVYKRFPFYPTFSIFWLFSWFCEILCIWLRVENHNCSNLDACPYAKMEKKLRLFKDFNDNCWILQWVYVTQIKFKYFLKGTFWAKNRSFKPFYVLNHFETNIEKI